MPRVSFRYRWERSVSGSVVESGSLKTGSQAKALSRTKDLCANLGARRAYKAHLRVVRSDGAIIATYEKVRGGARRV